MNGFSLVRNGLVCASLLICTTSVWAVMPTNPVTDIEFTRLPSGKKLTDIYVSGERLSLARGTGATFGETARKAYEKIKADTLTNPDSKVQWSLMDLDGHRVIAESLSSNRKIFGASSSKIFVGGTLLDKQGGNLTDSQTQLMANMLVVSSNEAWTNLQAQIGGGDSNAGRSLINDFTQRMGYVRTRGYQGYWGQIHGNELTAAETVEFLHDTYKGNYAGAETLWKFMHTCRTGADRGRKYIPSSVYVGAKTGTYDGPTVDPETGSSTLPNGREYTVAVRNHVMTFNVGNHQYGLVILADTGSDETTAVLAGGLFREYTGYTP